MHHSDEEHGREGVESMPKSSAVNKFESMLFQLRYRNIRCLSDTIFLEERHSKTIRGTIFIHAVSQTQFVIL